MEDSRGAGWLILAQLWTGSRGVTVEKSSPQELRREIARLQELLRQAEEARGGLTRWKYPAPWTPRFNTPDPDGACWHFYHSGRQVHIYEPGRRETLWIQPGRAEGPCPFWQIIHPDYRQVVKERGLARQKGQQVPSLYEFKVVTKEGRERWVRFAAGVFEFKGRPAILGSAFDISDHKEAQQDLLDSRKRLADIINFFAPIPLSPSTGKAR